MAPEFTIQELNLICVWASQAAEKARFHLSYWPEPYERAKAIFDKAHEERMKREREG